MTSFKHHPHHLHGIRVILFGMLLIALCLVRIDGSLLRATQANTSVLAYATSMSRSELLSETNAARAAQGLGALAIDGRLNTSAQNKAQHMVNNNYWAHVAPDGTQPWYFFDNAGYSYKNAGENLAYGFDSSSATVNGWLNSAPHRANIMGSYTDVGFGFVNGSSYQGGENTVVVAHYGTPSTPPPAPQPVAPTPPPSDLDKPTTLPLTSVTEQPVAETPSTATPVAETPVAEVAKPQTSPADKVPVTTANTDVTVPLWQRLGEGTLPIIGVLSLLLVLASTAGYGLTHRALVKHAWTTGENYVIHHPAIDVTVLMLITALILLTTTGRVG